MEDCKLAMDWKAVKRSMKAKEMTTMFFMIMRFSCVTFGAATMSTSCNKVDGLRFNNKS